MNNRLGKGPKVQHEQQIRQRSGEETNTNLIVFGLTQWGIENTIDHILYEQANNYSYEVFWNHNNTMKISYYETIIPGPLHESTHFILFALLKVHPRFFIPRLACGPPKLMGPGALAPADTPPPSQWAWYYSFIV
jgi:hypothetical protein